MIAQNQELRLVEIYQICSGYQPEERVLRDLLNNSSSIEFIQQRRANLNLCPFRVAYYVSTVQFTVENISDNKIISNKGSDQSIQKEKQTMIIDGLKVIGAPIQFFSLLQSTLNFSVKWLKASGYGVFDDNKKEWTGAIGMVKRGDADTFFNDLSIIESRSKAVAFTTAFRSYSYRLYMQKQKPTSSWSTFLNVFNSFYWGILALTILSFATILFFFSLGIKHFTKDRSMTCCMKTMSFLNALGTTTSAFLILDVNFSNLSTSRKILVLVLCMCGMVNFYAYNAGLISSLMDQNIEMPIKEIEDVILKPEYKLLMSKGSSQEFLKLNYNNVWKKSIEEQGVMESFEELLTEILYDNKKVSFMGSITAEVIARKIGKYFDPCRITSTKKEYNRDFSGYIFNKRSPYIELFNYHILKIIQNGLETELVDNKKVFSDCNDNMDNQSRAFSYNELISVFALFASGCVLAVLYSVFEYFFQTKVLSNTTTDNKRQNCLEIEIEKFRKFEHKTKNSLKEIASVFNERLISLSKEGPLDYHIIADELRQDCIRISNEFSYFVRNQFQETNTYLDKEPLQSELQ